MSDNCGALIYIYIVVFFILYEQIKIIICLEKIAKDIQNINEKNNLRAVSDKIEMLPTFNTSIA